jgi:hypothetical protein
MERGVPSLDIIDFGLLLIDSKVWLKLSPSIFVTLVLLNELLIRLLGTPWNMFPLDY